MQVAAGSPPPPSPAACPPPRTPAAREPRLAAVLAWRSMAYTTAAPAHGSCGPAGGSCRAAARSPDRSVVRQLSLGHHIQVPAAEVLGFGRDRVLVLLLLLLLLLACGPGAVGQGGGGVAAARLPRPLPGRQRRRGVCSRAARWGAPCPVCCHAQRRTKTHPAAASASAALGAWHPRWRPRPLSTPPCGLLLLLWGRRAALAAGPAGTRVAWQLPGSCHRWHAGRCAGGGGAWLCPRTAARGRRGGWPFGRAAGARLSRPGAVWWGLAWGGRRLAGGGDPLAGAAGVRGRGRGEGDGPCCKWAGPRQPRGTRTHLSGAHRSPCDGFEGKWQRGQGMPDRAGHAGRLSGTNVCTLPA